MKSRNNVIIVVGVVLAVLGAAFAVVYMRGGDDATDTRAVVVVTANVAPGTPAAQVPLAVRRVDVKSVPADALTGTNALNGQVALYGLSANQVVTKTMFGVRGSAATGGVVLPKGKKGIGVELGFAPGALRYVVPGDRIDVVDSVKNGDKATTKVLLRNVQVIATTPGAGTGEATPVQGGPGTLHFLLAVSEAEALKVVNAQASGHSLYFTLASTGKGAA